MFVRDFYGLVYAHWVEDERRLHGLTRVQIWTLHLLSAATVSRPGALVESASAKGSNKALWFEHVYILKIRHLDEHRPSGFSLLQLQSLDCCLPYLHRSVVVNHP